MSRETAKSFMEKLKTDAALADQVKNAKTADEVVQKAMEMGYAFSEQDLLEVTAQLSESELQGVSGGKTTCTCGYYSDGPGGYGHTGTY
jgi:predicted ribosomally synthesized peptide with nif11-like leader